MTHTYGDALLATLFTLAAATSAGVAKISLLGVSFTETVVTVASVHVTVAFLTSAGVLVGVAVLDSVSWDQLSSEKQALVAATVGVIGVTAVVPSIGTAIGDSVILGLAVLGIESGGFWAIAQSG